MSPIAIKIGNFVIYKYSLCILAAFLLGYILALKEAKKKGISKEFITDCMFYLIPVAIIGARLYYVLFSFNEFKDDLFEIVRVWDGGLAIHGGIISCLIFLIIYTKKHGINLLSFLDICAVSLVIGQAIGRWGNFFNQECYGPITSYSELKSLHIPNFIIDNMKIDGFYHHPTFLYESLGCIIIFIILLILRRIKKLKDGSILGTYLIGYGIIRFFIESMRQDSLMFLNLKIAQCVSIIMIISGITLIVYSNTIKHKNS